MLNMPTSKKQRPLENKRLINMSKNVIAVLGCGSWGTAIAMTLAKNYQQVMLWGHDPEHCRQLRLDRENKQFLPGVRFSLPITIETDLEKILQSCRDLVLVVPSHAFEETVHRMKPYLTEEHRIAWGTKGLDVHGRFLHQVVAEELDVTIQTAVLSGPSFAKEVAMALPTAITVASDSEVFASDLVKSLSSNTFRVYTCHDMVGVQIAGAVKNVLAVATGIADGLGLGANTRSAIITRGLAELMRLGTALGGRQETFMGLSGVGDLILTCTDNQSRNRRFGIAIGEGKDAQAAMELIGQVVEGWQTTKVVKQLAMVNQVEMPITDQVYHVLYEGLAPEDAVTNLLGRPSRAESC